MQISLEPKADLGQPYLQKTDSLIESEQSVKNPGRPASPVGINEDNLTLNDKHNTLISLGILSLAVFV